MKIYEHKPLPILRIHIHRMGEEREYLSVIECTMDEFLKFAQKTIRDQDIDPFNKGHKTSICIREAIGGDNLKSKSISFRGLSAKETLNLIVNKIETNEKSNTKSI